MKDKNRAKSKPKKKRKQWGNLHTPSSFFVEMYITYYLKLLATLVKTIFQELELDLELLTSFSIL